MATLQNIRDFTRSILQTDNVDLPDTLVDTFANESTQRVLGMRDDWQHLYTEGTLNMVAGTASYLLNSASFTPTTYISIESVWDDAGFGVSMGQLDYQEAAGRWIGPTAALTSDPRFFSIYGGRLYLWPKPNATRSLRVSGYRTPNLMSAGSDVPDIPTVFHSGIQYAVVSAAYAQQEDAELSQLWRQMANESIMVAMRNLFMNRRNRPILLFGRGEINSMSYDEWVRRNI